MGGQDMEKNRSIKIIAIIALCLSVVGLSVAFAAMNSSLTINGTAKVVPETLDVHFNNLGTVQKTLGGDVTTEPTLTATHIGNYAVTLVKPGSSVVYTFDVVNDGTLNTYLDTFTKPAPTFTGTSETKAAEDAGIVQNNLVYTLGYTTTTTTAQTGTVKTAGDAVAEDDQLLAGQTVGLTLTVAYKSDATTLPSDDVNITGLDITMIYAQLD